MKRSILVILVISCVFLSYKQFEANRAVVNNSFGTGERVEYRVHYGFINAAEAKVEIAKNVAMVNNRPCFKISATSRTTGAFDLITRVRDTWRTYLDTTSILPRMFQRSIQENKYRKEETVVFNHTSDQAISTVKDETKTYNCPNNVHDIISGYFFLRTVNFASISEGDIIEVPTFFDGEIYKLRVKYAGKDVIKTKFGKARVIRLNPIIPENKFFKGDNPMKLWVSDDVNRIPLKAEVQLMIGSLEMDIKSIKGLKQPIAFQE